MHLPVVPCNTVLCNPPSIAWGRGSCGCTKSPCRGEPWPPAGMQHDLRAWGFASDKRIGAARDKITVVFLPLFPKNNAGLGVFA